MKKIITVILIFVFLCPFLNIPMYIYSNISFYNKDTLLQDIQNNLEHYNSEDCSGAYLQYYGEHPKKVFEAALKTDFVPVDDIETIILLAFCNIDKKSKMLSMPLRPNGVLGNIQFFELDNKNYLLCHYRDNSFEYKLYTYEDSVELKSALNQECFSTDGLFKSAKRIIVELALYTLLLCYIPTIALCILFFVPYLFFANKKISSRFKNRITVAAKTGIALTPLCAVFCSIYIYKYSSSPELLPSFFNAIKEIFLRIIK